MPVPEWIETVKRQGLAAVASAVGMAPRGRGGYAPCPACGSTRRGSGDPRPPVTSGSRDGWSCVRGECQAAGDAVDLLAYKAAGKRYRDCSPEEKDAARELAEGARLVEPARADDRPTRKVVPRVAAGVTPRSAARTVVTRSVRATAPTVVVEDPAADPGGRVSGRDFVWREGLAEEAIERLWSAEEAKPVLDYLRLGRGALPGGADGRRLPDEAIRKWKLGAWQNPSDGGWWVTIPLLDERGRAVVNVKFRRIPLADGSLPKPKYMACPGRSEQLTLFGIGALPNDPGAPIVICEGELDVVAFWCFGFERGVVSGTAGAGVWREEWLDALEPYEQFVVAYDDDDAGQEGKGRAKLIEALGKDRCAEAKLPLKDAGECWLDEVDPEDFQRAVDRAAPMAGMRFVNAADAWDNLDRYAAGGKLRGLPTYCKPLDDLFGGWPYGMTVITGFPGSGKTTAATWAVTEQARHGVPGVLTSFEQGQRGSMAKVARQFLGCPIEEASVEAKVKARAAVAALPLVFADRDGRARLDEVVWSLRYARRRMGARIAMIDHLAYLIDFGSRKSETQQIDEITNTLANLGKELEMAILLLAHVRQVKDRFWHGKEVERARIAHLRGSTSIEGEASLGLVVEPTEIGGEEGKPGTGYPAATFHNDKQRSEYGAGAGQSAALFFDPIACAYSDRWDRLPNNLLFSPTKATGTASTDTGGRTTRTTRTAREAGEPKPEGEEAR